MKKKKIKDLTKKLEGASEEEKPRILEEIKGWEDWNFDPSLAVSAMWQGTGA